MEYLQPSSVFKKVGLALLSLSLLSACSDTEFSKKSLASESYTVYVGQVDVLFVVDNSGSMSEEQRRMADSFPNFVEGLELSGLDYRIGIVTTDIVSQSNPEVNNGVLQNGNLIAFPDKSYFLTPRSGSRQAIADMFRQTIQRNETAVCENSGFSPSLCPSDDERGIYAAYLTVNANKRDFFRKNGHVAFVFLSDEDVRGTGLNNHPFRLPEALDYPENLIQVVKTRLGNNTELSAHAIVTDSQSCRQQQLGQGGNVNIRGEIGQFYINMANPSSLSLINNSGGTLSSFSSGQLGQGVVGSICANDYVSELGSIRSLLSQTKSSERLRCKILEADAVDVRIDSQFSWTVNEDLTEVVFTPALPPGTSFEIEYECL